VAGGDRKLLAWARRAERLRAVPIDDEALAGISSLGTQAAKRRMAAGEKPDGTAFKPLSKRWRQRKAREGRSGQFWTYTGESKRKTIGAAVKRGVTTAMRWIINTPYSAAVHDGATFTVSRKSSSLASRQKQLKAAKKRKTAYSKRLAKVNGLRGKGSYAKAREVRADELRMARNARRRGDASLLPQYKRAEAIRRDPTTRGQVKLSWRVTIPARPVLGLSARDKIGVGRILAKAAQRRMEGDGG